MSRQPILPLPDDQASILVRALQPLLDAYPVGGRDHRPFVQSFLRAVHHATGRTYSPAIYRRLLEAYAPGRSPSTDTLAQEKRALDDELTQEAVAGRNIDSHSGEALSAIVQRGFERALIRQRTPVDDAAGSRYAQEQLEFLQSRLSDTELVLVEVRSQAARLAAELRAAQAVRDATLAQIDVANALAIEQSKRIEKLTEELAGQRRFAMAAIEGSRGETRAQLDRAAHLESLLKTEKAHTEVFRRLAYRTGAAIPDSLLSEGKT